jgi:hypothetical protein
VRTPIAHDSSSVRQFRAIETEVVKLDPRPRTGGGGTPFAIEQQVRGEAMRRLRTWLTAAAGLGILIAVLALVDDRVREQTERIVHGGAPSGEIVVASEQAQDIAYVFMRAVRDQSIEHAPLTVFGLAALVLVIFMTRT